MEGALSNSIPTLQEIQKLRMDFCLLKNHVLHFVHGKPGDSIDVRRVHPNLPVIFPFSDAEELLHPIRLGI